MRCPACSFENASVMKFCAEWGSSLKFRCSSCGFEPPVDEVAQDPGPLLPDTHQGRAPLRGTVNRDFAARPQKELEKNQEPPQVRACAAGGRSCNTRAPMLYDVFRRRPGAGLQHHPGRYRLAVHRVRHAGQQDVSQEPVYVGLKGRGLLVRYFSSPRLADCRRISIGTDEEIDRLLAAMQDLRHHAR